MTSLALIALLYPAFLLALYAIDRATGFVIADAFGKHVDKTTPQVAPRKGGHTDPDTRETYYCSGMCCGFSPLDQPSMRSFTISIPTVPTNPPHSDNDFPPVILDFQ